MQGGEKPHEQVLTRTLRITRKELLSHKSERKMKKEKPYLNNEGFPLHPIGRWSRLCYLTRKKEGGAHLEKKRKIACGGGGAQRFHSKGLGNDAHIQGKRAPFRREDWQVLKNPSLPPGGGHCKNRSLKKKGSYLDKKYQYTD